MSAFGDIAVSDVIQNRILIFSFDGVFSQAIGTPRGQGLGQLCAPEGIVVTNSGALAVVDGGTHRVMVFDSPV